MEGTAAAAAEKTEVKGTPGKLVSAGQPVKADMNVTDITNNTAAATTNSNGEGAADDPIKNKKDNGAAGDNKEKKEPVKVEPPALTEETTIAFLKSQGIEVKDFTELKSKVTAPAAAVAKTEEQIKAEEVEAERRMLDAHIKRGGTIESFTQYKQIASADPKVLGLTKLQQELLTDGFSKDDADLMIKRMQLEFTEEEIADFTPEQKAAVQKQAAFGLKKQENRGKYLQSTAKVYLDTLRNEVLERETESQKAAKHTSKVEDALKNFQRKQTIQLGDYNEEKLDPVDVEIPDDVIASVKDILSDPAKLDKLLYNAEGEFNLEFLVPHLVASISREKSVKHAFLEGRTNQVNIFKAQFGDQIPDLGGPRKTEKGKPGVFVGAGTPTLMQRQPQNN